MYKDKMTLFYNGEKLWEEEGNDGHQEFLIYDKRERQTWEVIIILPGVEVIPWCTFHDCKNVETVIMSDTVKRIEYKAFSCCSSLKFVKLSRNLEYIGIMAFNWCESLTSIFVPPSCREIGYFAFASCEKLIIVSVFENTRIGDNVFAWTKLFRVSPFEEVDRFGRYNNHDQVNEWVRDINTNQEYALHRACCSFNPLLDTIYQIVRRNGLQAFQVQNGIGITPSQYLDANLFAEVDEKKIIIRYILEMMGETV